MTGDDALRAKAAAAGIAVEWVDAVGNAHTVSPDTLRALLEALDVDEPDTALPPLIVGRQNVPTALPRGQLAGETRYRIDCEHGAIIEGALAESSEGTLAVPAIETIGYHRLQIGEQVATLAVTPGRCLSVAEAAGLARPRLWGLAVQLYGLASAQGGAIGDFGDLAVFARSAAAVGADAVAISPVHALFAAAPERYSPYYPSSRARLNILHADPAAVFSAEQIARAAAVAGPPPPPGNLIDWPAASRYKLGLLRALFEHCPLTDGLAVSLQRFEALQGEALEDHALFEAIHASLGEEAAAPADWRQWPAPYRDRRSAEVSAFADYHMPEIRFHVFAQWLAAESLARAQAASLDNGMALGLINDMAVGVAPGGSQTWSRPGEFLSGVTIGAPPDPFNQQGQDWGLTAPSPTGLRRCGFRSFRESLEAAMSHAGGVRIDHALGLERLWVIPQGAAATEGAYLASPMAEMIGLLALESVRRRTVVMGEDLGTVPEGFRDRQRESGIMGTAVLWFERDEHDFLPAADWRENAVAMTSTHDLPTVAGWWTGNDIAERQRLGLLSTAEVLVETSRRQRDCARLKTALAITAPAPAAEAVATAAAFHLGKTRSPLALLPLEDALAATEQANFPGTVDEHPNWRRCYPGGADALATEGVTARLSALALGRKEAP